MEIIVVVFLEISLRLLNGKNSMRHKKKEKKHSGKESAWINYRISTMTVNQNNVWGNTFIDSKHKNEINKEEKNDRTKKYLSECFSRHPTKRNKKEESELQKKYS